MEEKREKIKSGVIYVGSRRFDKETQKMVGKELSTYQLACIEQLKVPENKGKISIQARGRATSRAIDIAAILDRKLMAKISNVLIRSNSFEKEGREIYVTEIEIQMHSV